MKQETLSDKINYEGEVGTDASYLFVLDVKEAVKKLKEELTIKLKNESMKFKFGGFVHGFEKEINYKIDEIFGEKLT